MTAAQELFDLLKDAKPSEQVVNGRAVASLGSAAAPTGHRQATGRLFEAMPLRPFAELPELGGSASLVSTRGFDPVYCQRCAKPREQRRVYVEASEKLPAGSYLDVRPCEVCK